MGRVVRGHGHVVPAVIMDARVEADAILARAWREVEVARAELADVRAEAVRAGHDEGRAAAAADLAALLGAGRAEVEAMLARAQPQALAIATKMAEKIVGRAVALAPAVMAEIAAEALAACRARGGVVLVRVHPDDLAAVEAQRPALAARLGEATLELVADEGVGRHGCVVETPVGRVAARLATQLAALRGALAPDAPDAPDAVAPGANAGRPEVPRG
jgi:flagellar assembly protein FliH